MKKEILFILRKSRTLLGTVVGTVAGINLLLALAALFRDITMAAYLGTSSPADALLLAYFIPDTLGNLLLGTALGLACVPTFSAIYAGGQSIRLVKTLGKAVSGILLLATSITCVLILFRVELITNLGKGFTSETLLLCRRLFLIILPTLILFPLAAIGSALLQTFSRFTVPALAPVLFNLVFLGGILYPWYRQFPPEAGVYVASWSITLGVLAMVIVVWFSVYRAKIPMPDSNQPILTAAYGRSEGRELREISRTFISYLAVLLAGQSVLYFERFLASQLGEGSIAALSYAYRLSQFPIWVFVSAVGAVILPEMSRNLELQNQQALKATLTRSITLVLAITLPVTVLFFILKVPIVSILLERGAFDRNSLTVTAGVLAGYSLSITGASLVYIMLRYFLARRKMLFPLLVCLFSALVNIAADYVLVDRVGIIGLGYGAFLGSAISSGLLLILVRRKLDFSVQKGITTAGKILAANLYILAAALLVRYLWNSFIPAPTLLQNVFLVVLAASIGTVLYILALHRMKLFFKRDDVDE